MDKSKFRKLTLGCIEYDADIAIDYDDYTLDTCSVVIKNICKLKELTENQVTYLFIWLDTVKKQGYISDVVRKNLDSIFEYTGINGYTEDKRVTSLQVTEEYKNLLLTEENLGLLIPEDFGLKKSSSF